MAPGCLAILLAFLIELGSCGHSHNSCRREDVQKLKDIITNADDEQKNKIAIIKAEVADIKRDIATLNAGVSQILSILGETTKEPDTTVTTTTYEETPKVTETQPTTVTTENPDPQIGDTKALAAKSCFEILQNRTTTPPSGLYWIAVTPRYTTRLYCDMVTDGGGFTLVWTFTFTKYNTKTKTDDITPRPSWKLNKFMHHLDIIDVIVPVSTTPPTSEDQLGALKFKYWKLIGGNAFIVKSNFFNWVSCNETVGSIVDEGDSGSVNCKVIKYLSTELPQCSTVAPDSVQWLESKGSVCGMYLMRNKLAYMMFEVNSLSCWPIWDACGQSSKTRVLKDVKSPRVNVYIR